MITITQFTVGCSRTINLGNFESVRVESSVTVEVQDEKDAMFNANQMAQRELRKLLEETYKHQYVDKKKIA